MNKAYMSKKGFTLIELLIVVLIIGVLSGVILSVLNIKGIRSKSRDAQRVADLKKLQTALELYFTDNRAYPTSTNFIVITSDAGLNSALEPSYISVIPGDPQPSGSGVNPCSTNGGYLYKTDSNSSYYVLTARVEISGSADASLCSSLNNCSGGTISGCNCGDPCYGVENP